MAIFRTMKLFQCFPTKVAQNDRNANFTEKMAQNGPLSHRKIKCSFLDDYGQLQLSNDLPNPSRKMLTETQKHEKGPLSHQKIKCSFLDYVQLLMIGRAIRAKNVDQNKKHEKGPLSHQKIKCLFLDYIQLLMIG